MPPRKTIQVKDELADLKTRLEKLEREHGTCPSCGRCRECGRDDNRYVAPWWYPYRWYWESTPTAPTIGPGTITSSPSPITWTYHPNTGDN